MQHVDRRGQNIICGLRSHHKGDRKEHKFRITSNPKLHAMLASSDETSYIVPFAIFMSPPSYPPLVTGDIRQS